MATPIGFFPGATPEIYRSMGQEELARKLEAALATFEAPASSSSASRGGSAYVPSNNAAARGASHFVGGPNGEKIQLVPGAPGYDVQKALPYLGEIAGRDKELAQTLKDHGAYDQAMQGWGGRYNDLVAGDLRKYAALAASRGISLPANMTDKNLQDYQNLLDQIEIEKQIADGRIKEAPQRLPSGNFTDISFVGRPDYSGSFFNLDSQMQKDYADLQKRYNDLVSNQSNTVGGNSSGGGNSGGTVGAGGGTVGGGGVVDDGSSLNPDASSSTGAGTSGIVYGPDGTSYSSAAAAIAAGVPNFTFVKPVMPGVGANNSVPDLASFTNPDNTKTGNINPGALITNANTQLFQINRPKRVRLPTSVTGY